MTERLLFNPLTCQPLNGVHLIEANAGTGKTHNITRLFLRLIMEQKLSASQILVVTFTNDATEELRKRIRTTIRTCIDILADGKNKYTDLEHQDLGDYLEKWCEKNDRARGIAFLTTALNTFDEAAIFTIHGFCQRMLKQFPFESGMLFETELAADVRALYRETAADFYRKRVYTASPLFASFLAREKGLTITILLDRLDRLQKHPDLAVIPDCAAADCYLTEAAYCEAYQKICTVWSKDKETIAAILNDSNTLSAVSYSPAISTRLAAYLETSLRNPDPTSWLRLTADTDKLTTGGIAKGVKKNKKVPHHAFFLAWDVFLEKAGALKSTYENQIIALQREFMRSAEAELIEKKERLHLFSFNDLIRSLHKALQQETAGLLIQGIRGTFKAALVDEFQDTDQMQYTIFKTLFGSENSTPLFLIGDPKQAIYSFRNADIFTYLGAAAHIPVENQYTLSTNYRSEPGLVKAVNTIFNRSDTFIYDAIKPPESEASDNNPRIKKLVIKNQRIAPMKLWFLSPELLGYETSEVISVEEARVAIAEALANEIARLCTMGKEGRATLGTAPLEAADIAVLVRKHAEAQLIQEALTRVGITSVLQQTGNLFETPEIAELERVLNGIARPGNNSAIKNALSTILLGNSGTELFTLTSDDANAYQTVFEELMAYNDLWRTRGFMAMFSALLKQRSIKARLLQLPNGERRLTNLLHCAEVIHQKVIEMRFSIQETLVWLAKQRVETDGMQEEHLLRLERDASAVRIATIHASKGLQYPVVFCPFLWTQPPKNKALMFHDPQDTNKVFLDFGSETFSQNQAIADKESLAESIRLMYVALTRAQNLCYAAWGMFRKAETSAPAHVFHGSSYPNLSSSEMLQALEKIAGQSNGSIEIAPIPLGEAEPFQTMSQDLPPCEARHFSRKIDSRWKVSSFSGLTAHASHAEFPDRDQLHAPLVLDEKNATVDIHHFPAGARTGLFMHELFEELDFTHTDNLAPMILQKMAQYGFDHAFAPALQAMVTGVLTVTLPSAMCTLSQIPRAKRLTELEFYFPVTALSKNILNMEGLDFDPLKGFMHGFMDLVFEYNGKFFLVDWKSNRLGAATCEYNAETIAKTMDGNFYTLQYQIYLLALDRFLSVRIENYDYTTHIGGVYYIFLRGVSPDNPETGIFFNKPKKETIETLRTTIMGSHD
ncbi:MAG: exodeoxyribonuclease V subunit beta [Candidatus Raymondbacteria bacterium RifOxyA12_full_50_37]|uniref:DNA 3'-5' helicase n=1 Tax=Candidatus Raymondbacteria bacterium RIFOXYD12_FULL_49_13 TaxID=1817890 RepID=A0A1F7F9S3_UNCRA|nr:MAG: exodeoxyribonuclease V subunit beta [Candidatus Raymondbacteria bacterium RifOxyA12_full_50_37]OGJ87941.1 MAG: exodeoxyribonuclease V subunit beta [Candidatus Raymondbacteria bacterium RIFOXYA2_FULL_49_16]OGJ95632.1 MAG: exodeoxyribonuclease V subunit beta [Candidatus Raymondbacteria bacterium RIFOXYC2_FULL_50_21]OGK01765.1 MAG: exodeoxyribonuclease V subunit beta [Candidatus Raymondbacteria bacterium RifOxyC12_full_50_8]OGK03288.1 MAG: exodeoxyribonuclease V subunit beta [Candidatus Ra